MHTHGRAGHLRVQPHLPHCVSPGVSARLPEAGVAAVPAAAGREPLAKVGEQQRVPAALRIQAVLPHLHAHTPNIIYTSSGKPPTPMLAVSLCFQVKLFWSGLSCQ